MKIMSEYIKCVIYGLTLAEFFFYFFRNYQTVSSNEHSTGIVKNKIQNFRPLIYIGMILYNIIYTV